jgi:hypothetical protein
MVIETFRPGCKALVYERFHEKGRLLPDNLHYIESWLEAGGNRCFQLMETEKPQLFDQWMRNWQDLVSFEVVELEAKTPNRPLFL